MILNLALRFILEVCALVALSYWGFQSDKDFLLRFGLGIGIPMLVAVIWGVFGSPAAPLPVKGFIKILLQLIIFGLATSALYAAGKPSLAIMFAILVVLNSLLLHIWEQ